MSELFSKSNDGQIQQNGLIMSTDEVIDYLNTSNNAIGSLQYENAQLQKENKRLKERNDELEESSAFIIEQREENKQLKKSEKINMGYAEQIVEENQQLRIAKNDLRIENEQLKKEYKIAIDEMVTDYKKLEEENEQLREALKNSYNWEICENCEYANYSSHYVYAEGIEYDFECLKGHAHVDEMSECDEFKLKIR